MGQIFYSASTHGFYDTDIHGSDMPADAVRISRLRHAQLMEAQASGRQIAARDGKPVIASARTLPLEDLRAAALRAVKAEAEARILAVASLARQSNDNALIAEAALAVAGGDTRPAGPELQAARLRRTRINAIREASDAIEAIVAKMPASNLKAFNAAANSRWPPAE